MKLKLSLKNNAGTATEKERHIIKKDELEKCKFCEGTGYNTTEIGYNLLEFLKRNKDKLTAE